VNTLELTKSLMTLSKMFTIGCEILVSPEVIVIKGYDMHKEKEHFAVERTYEIDLVYNEDGSLIDNFSKVLPQIAKDSGV
jgi:hypothetical protein